MVPLQYIERVWHIQKCVQVYALRSWNVGGDPPRFGGGPPSSSHVLSGRPHWGSTRDNRTISGPPLALDDEEVWKDHGENSRLIDDGCALVCLIDANILESATPWPCVARVPAGHPLLAAGPSVVV